jgi:hypothetical protein
MCKFCTYCRGVSIRAIRPAESEPGQKDLMIRLILDLLEDGGR